MTSTPSEGNMRERVYWPSYVPSKDETKHIHVISRWKWFTKKVAGNWYWEWHGNQSDKQWIISREQNIKYWRTLHFVLTCVENVRPDRIPNPPYLFSFHIWRRQDVFCTLTNPCERKRSLSMRYVDLHSYLKKSMTIVQRNKYRKCETAHFIKNRIHESKKQVFNCTWSMTFLQCSINQPFPFNFIKFYRKSPW